MYIINEENLFANGRMLQLHTHPDTSVREYVTGDELFRRSVDGNMHKKETLYMKIKFLEGKLREVNEDIWFPDSLGNQCKRAIYTRNLEGLKKFRKYLYNCEGASYHVDADKIAGMHLEFNM